MKHESVQAIFSRIASTLPTNIAIEVGSRQVSYVELEEKSNSLANFLLANGATAGSPVAVGSTGSATWVACTEACSSVTGSRLPPVLLCGHVKMTAMARVAAVYQPNGMAP